MSEKIDHLTTFCETFRELTDNENSMVCGAAGKGPMEVMGPAFRGPVTSVPDFPFAASAPRGASAPSGIISPGMLNFYNQLNHPGTTAIQNLIKGRGH
ncbi:hypothetical protein [Burkholderia pseudomallei]|uniref:hypothetical protein n=1 Tax=Burkholderia pseudomallei TaxID=28450 RepID=UPI0012F7BBC1|nr:hypothetical protein [Burkholderia pseudomallei]